VKTLFIEPGLHWENGSIESVNGKLRDELLKREAFDTLLEAKVLIERGWQHCNVFRLLFQQDNGVARIGRVRRTSENHQTFPRVLVPVGASDRRHAEKNSGTVAPLSRSCICCRQCLEFTAKQE